VAEWTAEPVYFAEPTFIVGAEFLALLRADFATTRNHAPGPADPSAHADGLGMLKLALIALVAGTVLLKVAARRDLLRVVHVQELASIALLALIREPMNAHSLLPLALIHPLLLRLLYRVELVARPYSHAIHIHLLLLVVDGALEGLLLLLLLLLLLVLLVILIILLVH